MLQNSVGTMLGTTGAPSLMTDQAATSLIAQTQIPANTTANDLLSASIPSIPVVPEAEAEMKETEPKVEENKEEDDVEVKEKKKFDEEEDKDDVKEEQKEENHEEEKEEVEVKVEKKEEKEEKEELSKREESQLPSTISGLLGLSTAALAQASEPSEHSKDSTHLMDLTAKDSEGAGEDLLAAAARKNKLGGGGTINFDRNLSTQSVEYYIMHSFFWNFF